MVHSFWWAPLNLLTTLTVCGPGVLDNAFVGKAVVSRLQVALLLRKCFMIADMTRRMREHRLIRTNLMMPIALG